MLGKSTVLLVATIFAVGCVVEGKVYDRCSLASELRWKYNLPKDQIADWVCIAEHESSFNTAALGRPNSDGSQDHGLFQINDRYWCSPPGPHNDCGVSCAALRDDNIDDDVKCIRKIYARHGFSAWVAWKNNCRGKNLSKYVAGCKI
uniref:lysozyme n=2 Tax=Ornithodoros moubata TaxID=6938 RepID=Q95V68_ORNMO|nr:lysozyme precursor [Ornithodoros moubata]